MVRWVLGLFDCYDSDWEFIFCFLIFVSNYLTTELLSQSDSLCCLSLLDLVFLFVCFLNILFLLIELYRINWLVWQHWEVCLFFFLPLQPQITFSEGQALSTITLTILADSVAELSETVDITLSHVTTVGVQDATKGAIIDPKRARAVLTILPSDSPYGVIGWHTDSLFVKVTEPEGNSVTWF